MIVKVTRYGKRRNEDFDKYQEERLSHVAHSTKHPMATTYDITAETLREKLHFPREQFKVYFLAFLAEKEYSGILDSLLKGDKLFKRKGRCDANQPTPVAPNSNPASRIRCWHCGIVGHRAAQCFRKDRSFQPALPEASTPVGPYRWSFSFQFNQELILTFESASWKMTFSNST